MEITLLEAEALRLSEHDRALLADRLLQSLAQENPVAAAAWAEEAERRFAAYQRGEIEAVDGESALAKIRKNLR